MNRRSATTTDSLQRRSRIQHPLNNYDPPLESTVTRRRGERIVRPNGEHICNRISFWSADDSSVLVAKR